MRKDSLHLPKLGMVRATIQRQDLRLQAMTRSASGTVERPGRNVTRKRGLNRAILDVAPGQIRRMTA